MLKLPNLKPAPASPQAPLPKTLDRRFERRRHFRPEARMMAPLALDIVDPSRLNGKMDGPTVLRNHPSGMRFSQQATRTIEKQVRRRRSTRLTYIFLEDVS